MLYIFSIYKLYHFYQPELGGKRILSIPRVCISATNSIESLYRSVIGTQGDAWSVLYGKALDPDMTQ